MPNETELEQLQRQCAAMRAALFDVRDFLANNTHNAFVLEHIAAVEDALSSDAGTSLFTREQVQPLVGALVSAHEALANTPTAALGEVRAALDAAGRLGF